MKGRAGNALQKSPCNPETWKRYNFDQQMEEAVMILKTLGAASGRTLSCDLNQCDVFDF